MYTMIEETGQGRSGQDRTIQYRVALLEEHLYQTCDDGICDGMQWEHEEGW